jgi:uncharacterized protein YbaR (Trm112 family)
MLSAELLEMLRCPETMQTLRAVEPALLERLNGQIAAGTLKNRGGEPVTEPLEGGLIRADGRRLYPICHDIPIMLAEEAIAL